MVDLLEALHVKPDGIIGHSLGELASAYADGCLSKRETMLASYYRGKASIEIEFDRGMMASIGNKMTCFLQICFVIKKYAFTMPHY